MFLKSRFLLSCILFEIVNHSILIYKGVFLCFIIITVLILFNKVHKMMIILFYFGFFCFIFIRTFFREENNRFVIGFIDVSKCSHVSKDLNFLSTLLFSP